MVRRKEELRETSKRIYENFKIVDYQGLFGVAVQVYNDEKFLEFSKKYLADPKFKAKEIVGTVYFEESKENNLEIDGRDFIIYGGKEYDPYAQITLADRILEKEMQKRDLVSIKASLFENEKNFLVMGWSYVGKTFAGERFGLVYDDRVILDMKSGKIVGGNKSKIDKHTGLVELQAKRQKRSTVDAIVLLVGYNAPAEIYELSERDVYYHLLSFSSMRISGTAGFLIPGVAYPDLDVKELREKRAKYLWKLAQKTPGYVLRGDWKGLYTIEKMV